MTTESEGGLARITLGLLPSAAVDRALIWGLRTIPGRSGFLALRGSSIGQKRSDMRVSDVFTLAGGSGSGGDSYSNFGCSAGDCYAGDYGRYSFNYYQSGAYNTGPNGRFQGNESATRDRGFDQVFG